MISSSKCSARSLIELDLKEDVIGVGLILEIGEGLETVPRGCDFIANPGVDMSVCC